MDGGEIGKKVRDGPVLPTWPGTPIGNSLEESSLGSTVRMEANGRLAPNCKCLSKHPPSPVNVQDTLLGAGNPQPLQLALNSRNINLPWPENSTNVCSLLGVREEAES